jgi:hypothetical protein
MHSSPVYYYFITLWSKHSPQHSQTHSVCVLPVMLETKFHTSTKLQQNNSVEIVEFIKFSEMVNHACEYINVYFANFV